MTNLTWTAAVKLLATEADAQMPTVAADLLDRVPKDQWRDLLVWHLVAEAKRVRREDALRIERKAEKRTRKVSAREWEAWSTARKTNLGLSNSATPIEMVSTAISNYTREIKLEWTRELLQSTFTLEDGSRVTWGGATEAMHRERAAMFSGLAEINAQGAERHREAIREIRRLGVACLNDAYAEALA